MTKTNWMRGIGLLLVVMGCASLVIATAQPSNESLFVLRPTLSTTSVHLGKSIAGSLTLINYSFSPVTVKVSPSCGCTVVNAPNDRLMPFAKVTLPVRVFTDGFPKGEAEKYVAIKFLTESTMVEKSTMFKFVVN